MYRERQIGAALLIMTLIIMLSAGLIMVFAASYGMLQQKTVTNQQANDKAFAAAEAGLDYGVAYLVVNSSTVIASASGGLINYTLSTTTQADNSTYSVVITNPTINNYTLLTVTSTGKSPDGSSTRVVAQQVYSSSTSIPYSISGGGNISMVGGSVITNTVNNQNLQMGGTLTINNGAYTVTSSGTTTTQGNIGSDVQQNVASLSGLSESSFFQLVFNTPEATLLSTVQAAGNYYNNAVSGGDYSQTLSGKTGKTIWINQSSVTLGQGVTIGSLASPVTLIVEGSLTIANGVTIYGFVYASGVSSGFNLAGGAKIYGGIASPGQISMSNGFQLVYQKVSPIAGGSSAGTYSKLPGSWADF
jgi:Tfp pilus assembly protein PilX